MSKTICRICLRIDLKFQEIEETLADFHDEIAEYAIYQNPALKYCTVCEYLLRKCYNFSQRCRQANTILKEFKTKKRQGFPSDLHEKLPPLLSCSIPATLQQFDLIDGTLIPLSVQLAVMKQENDTDDDLDTNDNAQDVDCLQINAEESDVLIDEANDSSIEKLQNNVKNEKTTATKLADIDLEAEDKCSDNVKHENTSEHIFEIEVKCENYPNDSDEDSSDTELIKEFNKRIEAYPTKGKKKESKKRSRKPLQNNDEINKVFEVQMFATDQEAKEELEQRKTSEYYQSAQHKCEICKSVFKHAKNLDFHMRWHDPSAGSHVCGICHMKFKSKDSVKNHKHNAHVGRFKCKKCPLITYNKTVMMKHYQQHAGMIFKCKICSRTYTHRSTYNTHMREQHKTEHACVTCARTFVSEKGLIAHRGMIHNTKSLVDIDGTAPCEPCGLTFANEKVYTIHLNNTDKHKELANEMIACWLCGIRFEDFKSLKEHRRSQHYIERNIKSTPVYKTKDLTTEEDNFTCAICGVEGTSRLWVYKHVEVAHPNSPYAADLERRRTYMCETCGKCYASPYTLRDHMNTHSDQKPHPCKQCPARFKTRVKLKLHEDCHAPAKRECKRCGKKFISASNLSCHMRTHIQDRRYKCSFCNKGFLHAWALREHIRGVHNNVRRERKLVKSESIREN